MKSLSLLVTIVLLVSCSAFEKTINKSQYVNADKVIYEKYFGESVEIRNKAQIARLIDIIGSAQKEAVDFIPKDQFVFIRSKDTISIQRNGALLRDGNGTYRLGAYMSTELNKLLEK